MTDTDRKPASDTETDTDRATANFRRALQRAVADAFSGKLDPETGEKQDDRS